MNWNFSWSSETSTFSLLLQVELPVNHIHLTSKYGQRYQCYFPDQVESEKKTEEKEKEALETGIPELLKPLETGPCLLKVRKHLICTGLHSKFFSCNESYLIIKTLFIKQKNVSRFQIFILFKFLLHFA